MFDLIEGDECYWPVQLPRVNAEGEVEDVQVLILYRRYTRAELRAIRTDAAERATQALSDAMRAGDPAQRQASLDELQRVDAATEADVRSRILGWKGIDYQGQPAPFSAELRDRLLAHEERYAALRNGLYEASRVARAKN